MSKSLTGILPESIFVETFLLNLMHMHYTEYAAARSGGPCWTPLNPVTYFGKVAYSNANIMCAMVAVLHMAADVQHMLEGADLLIASSKSAAASSEL